MLRSVLNKSIALCKCDTNCWLSYRLSLWTLKIKFKLKNLIAYFKTEYRYCCEWFTAWFWTWQDCTWLLMFQMCLRFKSSLSGRTFQGPLAPIPLQGIHGGLPGILSTSIFQYICSVQFNDEVISRTKIVRVLKMLCLMNFSWQYRNFTRSKI